MKKELERPYCNFEWKIYWREFIERTHKYSRCEIEREAAFDLLLIYFQFIIYSFSIYVPVIFYFAIHSRFQFR